MANSHDVEEREEARRPSSMRIRASASVAALAAIGATACGGTAPRGFLEASDAGEPTGTTLRVIDAATSDAEPAPATNTEPAAAEDAGGTSKKSTASSGGCGEFAGDTAYTCSKDGNSRGKCPDGETLTVETCARGCDRAESSTTDSECLTTEDNWSCTGSYSTVKSTSGDYYMTEFGCWTDSSGTVHTDDGDNCIPNCLDQARSAGLCAPGSSGPDCEEAISWYTADSGRFGCLARVRITNPATGVAVVAVVLDAGPSCSSVEDKVSKGVLDASGLVNLTLFGGDQGWSDESLVHVVEVDPSTPLGVVSGGI